MTTEKNEKKETRTEMETKRIGTERKVKEGRALLTLIKKESRESTTDIFNVIKH